MSDNFNNGTSWRIALSRLGTLLENHKLQLELFPLAPDYRIYFEKVPAKEDVVKTAIKKIEVIPKYETVLSIVSVEEN
ncbi:MAG: hypothetical protein P8Y99_11275 [Calditrichaceae bacterium]